MKSKLFPFPFFPTHFYQRQPRPRGRVEYDTLRLVIILIRFADSVSVGCKKFCLQQGKSHEIYY